MPQKSPTEFLTPLAYHSIDPTGTHAVIRDAEGYTVILVPIRLNRVGAYSEAEAARAARRVAACINAVEGIATGALEAGTVRALIDAIKDTGAVT